MLLLVKVRIKFRGGFILLKCLNCSWVVLFTALWRFSPKFCVAVWNAPHVSTAQISIKTKATLIKIYVLFSLHWQNKLTFVNERCGLVQNTYFVAQCRHVIHCSFRNIRYRRIVVCLDSCVVLSALWTLQCVYCITFKWRSDCHLCFISILRGIFIL